MIAIAVALGVVLAIVTIRMAATLGRRRRVRCRLAEGPDRATGPLWVAAVHARVGRVWPHAALDVDPSWLQLALERADLGAKAGGVLTIWIVGTLVTASVGLVAVGRMFALAAGLIAVAVPAVALHGARGRSQARLVAELPSVVEAIARSLRSGASINQAVVEAAGEAGAGRGGLLSRELAQVRSDLGRQQSLRSAVEHFAARCAAPGVDLVAAAICLGQSSGGSQARALDGLACTLRDRVALGAEVRALSSQARMSALVIGLAPVGFAMFSASADKATGQFLFNSGVGRTLLAAGLLLDLAGWCWMQRLCRLAS